MSRRPSAPPLSLGTTPGATPAENTEKVLAPCPKCGEALAPPPALAVLVTGSDDPVCLACARRRHARRPKVVRERIELVHDYLSFAAWRALR